ncbi:hypothetical protein [Pseudomonas sp. RIT-PI-S]|uniref:hypothetical protein n=1 Tax=Pseudomonas sp. RIT-PI-S TaxID=3035295 RepID=UPI0021D9DC06|nr:hypothetical protein [Pseudomonas sp. RIT-PI-S]
MKLSFTEQLLSTPASTGDSPALRYVRGYARHSEIANVSTRLALLETASQQWVVSVNEGAEHAGNCYVVSPLAAYGGYALAELERLRRPWLTWPLKAVVAAMQALLHRARLDRVVWVNNWLLSTNLYPARLDGAELAQLTTFLRTRFSDHALGFRSLNDFSNPGLRDALHALGYRSVPSRQVYLFDGRDGAQAAFLRHHNTRLDATLLRRSPYQVVPGEALDDADFQRIEHLYNLLYLHKYSRLNPHYRAQWIRRGQREGWLELRALRNLEGRVDGVVGWFTNAVGLSAPIVGYNTSLPQRSGLYRQLTSLCLQEATRRRELLNFSAGASRFKRLRGGQPQIEYSLVYVAHLPWARRCAWAVLSRLLHTLAVPLMKRFEL